jgi:hypothetical protein
LSYKDISTNLCCPDCNEPAYTELQLDKKDLFFSRIHPSDLQIGDWIFMLPMTTAYEILNLDERETQYYIALKQYGHIYVSKNDYVAKML